MVKIKFEKERDIKRVSYLICPTIFEIIFKFCMVLFFWTIFYLISKHQLYGYIPIWIYIIFLVLLLLPLLPKKTVFEYDSKKEIFTQKKYGFIFYKKTTITKKVMENLPRDNLKIPLKSRRMINPLLNLFGLVNNLTSEQYFQISKFLEINPIFLTMYS